MIYFWFILCWYICTGFGFTLASWLQAAEICVEKDEPVIPFFDTTMLMFWLLWPIMAVFCYRADVSKTISKEQVDKLFGDND